MKEYNDHKDYGNCEKCKYQSSKHCIGCIWDCYSEEYDGWEPKIKNKSRKGKTNDHK